ncbi:MAG: Uma2 family endonuclease [Spirochaetia bacterium]|nr:Uma2 family endonuclease [Spirochaetia bacterium]
MAIPDKRENGKFNYDIYQNWPETERWELIEGEAFDMSPAPNTNHQRISMTISGEIYNYLKGQSCESFSAPFDVRLSEMENPEEQDIETVVQPDIVVVCDRSKIDERGCIGAPDIVIEILSPSTGYKDETSKLALYEKYGVKEYWIVNPEAEYIMIYHLEGKKYSKPDYLRKEDFLESIVLKGLKINLQDIFSHNL